MGILEGYGNAVSRNLVAFWFFGLCNNYGYVIMLSAAHDILAKQGLGTEHNVRNDSINNNTCADTNVTTKRACNEMSTAVVLLCDILPALIVKIFAPFFVEHIAYGFRQFIVVFCQVLSYFMLAYSSNIIMSLGSVVVCSFAAGLGELTFLSISSHYSHNVISTWSSGTGMAGVLGSLSYAALLQLNITVRKTVLIMLVMPFVFAVSYWGLMVSPKSLYLCSLDPRTWIVPSTWPGLHHKHVWEKEDTENQEQNPRPYQSLHDTSSSCESLGHVEPNVSPGVTHGSYGSRNENMDGSATNEGRVLSLTCKLKLMAPLLRYMIPLFLVYYAEYLINQGLQELLCFSSANIGLEHKDQYRWYQVLYQVGVMISRSSVNLIKVPTNWLPILPIMQISIAVFLTCEAYFFFLPSIWIVFAIIFVEGLLGGSTYVNAFYRIGIDTHPRDVEFCMGMASAADSFGITLSGFSSIPLHNWICDQPLPSRHYL